MGGRRIAVIGLGYVGLPVAVAFAKAGFDTLGFDIDPARVAEIAAAYRRLTHEEEMGALFKVIAFTGRRWPEPTGFA